MGRNTYQVGDFYFDIDKIWQMSEMFLSYGNKVFVIVNGVRYNIERYDVEDYKKLLLKFREFNY